MKKRNKHPDVRSERTYKVRLYDKKIKKEYHYVLKFIFGVQLTDLIELLGPDAACKLLKYYGGGTIYIPKLKTVHKRLRDSEIRRQYDHFKSNGTSNQKAIEQLRKNFGVGRSAISKIIGTLRGAGEKRRGFHYTPEMLEERKRQARNHRIQKEMDKKLVELVTKHHRLFRSHGLI